MHRIFLVLAFFYVSTAHTAVAQRCINPYQKIGYKYYYIEKHEKLNWFAAAARCLELGGNLATIENEAELNELSSYLLTQGYIEGETSQIWISGLGIRGSYLAFGNPPKLLPYAKWNTNEPNDLNSNESCLHLIRHGKGFFMNDCNCRQEKYFICETKDSNIYVPSRFLWQLEPSDGLRLQNVE